MDGKSGFLDPADFPFTAVLEENAPIIRDELDRILPGDAFISWPETFLYNEGWDVFGFSFFGKRIPENCALCPRTAAIVEAMAEVTTAGFSRLSPGTRIRPHTGYTDTVLRCHLGLVTPAGCGLRVGEETRAWEEGKCLIFDDTLEHEAWNDSKEDRIVLLLDFLKQRG